MGDVVLLHVCVIKEVVLANQMYSEASAHYNTHGVWSQEMISPLWLQMRFKIDSFMRYQCEKGQISISTFHCQVFPFLDG